jgi:pSer/pThr/pTyr-binding forkhead associated (FHA) protein
MALTVVVRSGDAKSPPKVTFDAPRIVIGRGEGCDVRLPDPSVSHRHASIRQRGSEYLLVDEGSTNGTFVGPVRLSPHAPRVVRSGEMVRVGRIWLELSIEHIAPTVNPAMATREIALGLVAEALAAQGEPATARVSVIQGPDTGRELEVSEPGRAYVVGRGQGVDLVLTDADASRRHVEILRRGSQLFVRDLGSKNGARFGDRPLEPDKETAWPASVILVVGANRLSFQDPVAEALAELERSADERMRDDDSVDPPTTADDAQVDAVEPQLTASPIAEGGASPITRVPSAPKPPREPPRGWTMTDVVVALIALCVLTLSILGIWWLFRST